MVVSGGKDLRGKKKKTSARKLLENMYVHIYVHTYTHIYIKNYLQLAINLHYLCVVELQHW